MKMNKITTMEGAEGIALAGVAHLLVPGRGRDASGHRLTSTAELRVREAARVFKTLRLSDKGGVIVVCGYKSPGDQSGKIDEFMKGYFGTPEADLMAKRLIQLGIPEMAIRIERDSIDTVTNLVFAECADSFPDNRPVAIVAQRGHLKRIVQFIAPKVLKRSFIGVIAPDAEVVDRDSVYAGLFSRLVLFRVTSESKDYAVKIHRKASRLWRLANVVRLNRQYKQR